MEPLRSRSAGGIVIGDGGMIALVQSHSSGTWLFPKGHPEDTETDEEAARREVQEETGLDNLELLDDLGEYERFRIGKDGTPMVTEIKTIHMYLFAAEPHAEVLPSLEITAAAWFPFRELAEHIGNDKDRAWFASVAPRVREAIQRD